MSEENLYQEERSDGLLEFLIETKVRRDPKLLTKSKFLNGLQCPKLLWTRCNAPLEIPEPTAALQKVFDTGHLVSELATRCFPGGVHVQEDDFLKNLAETQALLASKDPKPIYEAGIKAGRLYARADILRPSPEKPGVWDVIEVKCSTKCKDVYLQDIAFQRYCYEQAGIRIGRCYLMHVNNTYVRDGDINPHELFTLLDVTEEIKPFYGVTPSLVKGFLDIIDMPACPHISIREHCRDPYECQMIPICWAFLPREHVLELYRGKSKGFDLIDQGVLRLKDIPDNVKLSANQQIQRVCAITQQPHVELDEINTFIKSLRYPLYFMDFETIFEVLPRFNGTRPYQQIPFQFSVHIQRTPGGPVEHHAFLHKKADDPRLEFIKALSACMGQEGDVVAYNQSFEKLRLKEIGEQFPAYRQCCEDINLRLVDLLVPFQKFYYYHPDEHGSASLKKVLPALTGKGYEGMPIADGGQATSEYSRVTYGAGVDPIDRAKVYADLEAYCGLDTGGMVDILTALRVITKG